MAYSQGSLDQNLDSLGSSYVDGVSVQLAKKYQVNCDFASVDSLLRGPGPSVLRSDVHYDTTLERKVLEDFQKKQVEEEEKAEARRRRIEQYDNQRAEELAKKRKEEEEKAVEDERLRLQEIQALKLAQRAEEEKQEAERARLREEAATKKKAEEEAEWTQFEEERRRNVTAESSPSPKLQSSSSDYGTDTGGTDGGEEPINPQFVTPPQEPVDPKEIHVVGTQSSLQGEKINFSDFEALSDPFADLELKTMDDLAELRSILATQETSPPQPQPQPQHQHQPQCVANPGTYRAPPVQGGYPVGAGGYGGTGPRVGQGFPPHQFPPPFSRHYSTGPVQYPNQYSGYPPPTSGYSTGTSHHNTQYTSTGQFSSVSQGQTGSSSIGQYSTAAGHHYSTVSSAHSLAQGGVTYSSSHTPTPTGGYYPTGMPQHYPTHTPTVASTPTGTPTVTPTPTARSVSSDRRTERLKDPVESPVDGGGLKPSRSVGNIITDLQKESSALAQAKGSRPNSRPQSRGATGLENWVPWPRLEGDEGPGGSNGNPLPEPSDDSCLADLMDDEANSCRQLHEMGFPLSRLAKGCQAVGANHQKLINFCLVVDRLVEEGHPELEASHVAMLHNADEAVCRTHLRSFSHLAEIGFPPAEVHEALIQHSFDHQAALDQLIT